MRPFTLNTTRIPLIAIALLVSGCSLLRDTWSGPQQRLSGLLEHRGDAFVLTQCGSDHAQPVNASNSLNEVFAKAAQPGQRVIFVDMLGQVDRSERITSGEVLRMQSQGRGCSDHSGDGAQWIALQYKPAWRVALAANGLTRSDAERGYPAQPVVTEQSADGSLNARSLQGDELELWLYPQACQDLVTGDYFHMSATLLVDGERFTGCAYQGRQTAP